MCKSVSKAPIGIDELTNLISNYNTRAEWDLNFESGHEVKQLGESCHVEYQKTKKIGMMSSRDLYLVVSKKIIPA